MRGQPRADGPRRELHSAAFSFADQGMARARDGPGTVYVLSNPSFRDDVLKVGRTGRDVGAALRARELRGTGVPTPFVVESTFACSRMCAVERVAHEFLAAKRVASDREFFLVPARVAEGAVRRARAWTSWGALLRRLARRPAAPRGRAGGARRAAEAGFVPFWARGGAEVSTGPPKVA